jgi:hypothetical protein
MENLDHQFVGFDLEASFFSSSGRVCDQMRPLRFVER